MKTNHLNKLLILSLFFAFPLSFSVANAAGKSFRISTMKAKEAVMKPGLGMERSIRMNDRQRTMGFMVIVGDNTGGFMRKGKGELVGVRNYEKLKKK